MVEIDNRVIENTRKYFKYSDNIDKYVHEGRLEIIIEDAAKYLRDNVEKKYEYDGLIIDNSDNFVLNGPADSLFSFEFYTNIYRVLKPGAAFSQQVTDEFVQKKWEDLTKSVGFKDFSYVITNIPEYSNDNPLGKARKPLS